MNLDELTLGELKTIRSMLSSDPSECAKPYAIGTNVFIRTITMFLTGRLVEVTSQELVLEEAAWVADAGRFANALQTGELKEVEPFPMGRVIIGRGAVVDCCEWNHTLPRTVK